MAPRSWCALVMGIGLMLGAGACGGGGGGGDVPVGGTLFFSQESNANGLFVLDTSTGAATLVGAGVTGSATGNVGLTEGPSDSILWGTTKDDVAWIAADGSGATVLAGSANAEGLAYHAPDGLLFATEDGFLSAVHPVTGAVVAPLTGPPEDLEGLASDADADRLYAIGDTTLLYAYDVPTDTWSVVGDTGVNWDRAGLAFDPNARVLYAVGDGGGNNLFRIDPDTAAVSLVGPTGLLDTAGGLGFLPAE